MERLEPRVVSGYGDGYEWVGENAGSEWGGKIGSLGREEGIGGSSSGGRSRVDGRR